MRPAKSIRELFGRLVGRKQKRISEIERAKRVVRMVGATKDNEIACDEAYRLLDQYAEAIIRGDDPSVLFPEVTHHLELCMDCREELDALLEALQA